MTEEEGERVRIKKKLWCNLCFAVWFNADGSRDNSEDNNLAGAY